MTRTMSRAALALAALLLASACSDTTTPPPPPPPPDAAVRGVVTDALGRPAPGASIVLQLDSALVPGSEADKPQQGVRFDLGTGGHVHVWVTASCGQATIRTIIDTQLPSGTYIVFWNALDDLGRQAPDGMYRLHAVWDGGESSFEIILLGTHYDLLTPQQSIAAEAITDLQGAFRLETGCLPFGYTLPAYDESGLPIGQAEITRRVRVWAFRDGVVPAVSDWVTVDPEAGAVVAIGFAYKVLAM